MVDYTNFDFSVTGYSHIKKNTICQDSSFSYKDDDMIIGIVSDGHGGSDYFRSDIGSKFATQCAFSCIKKFIFDNIVQKTIKEDEQENLLKQLELSIYEMWNQKVEEHFKENKFMEDEYKNVSEKNLSNYLAGSEISHAYGTTLIAIAISKNICFGLQIGDGKCIAMYKDGCVSEPIPWDENCFLNATTSLCDTDANLEFRHFISNNIPIALYVGTDGIDDSYQNEQQLYNMYSKFTHNFIEEGLSEGIKQIGEFLPLLTQKGSGDDVSVSGIINFGAIETYVSAGGSKEWSIITNCVTDK